MKNLLFQAKNMCKFYPGTKALKGVDMDIYEGEVIGLIGENGYRRPQRNPAACGTSRYR